MTFATGRVPHAGSRQPGASTEEQQIMERVLGYLEGQEKQKIETG